MLAFGMYAGCTLDRPFTVTFLDVGQGGWHTDPDGTGNQYYDRWRIFG